MRVRPHVARTGRKKTIRYKGKHSLRGSGNTNKLKNAYGRARKRRR